MLILLLCIRRNRCSLFFECNIRNEFWSALSFISPTENPDHLSLEYVANFFILDAKCFIHKLKKGLILLCASNLFEYNSLISSPDLCNNRTARLLKPYEFIKRFDLILLFFMLCFSLCNSFIFDTIAYNKIYNCDITIKRNKCCSSLVYVNYLIN